MTYQKQDILEDWYEGDNKDIEVIVYNKDGSRKDLTNAEITYVIMDREDYDTVYLRKQSANGSGEIEITDAVNGVLMIHILPPDTLTLHGTFRHHLNVRDQYNKQETVFTGLVRIHETSGQPYREISQKAYLIGTT